MRKEIDFFDRTENILKMRRVFITILALLVVLDLFIDKHPTFPWEALPGFNAIYGFIACVVIVVASNLLGRWLKKKEDYYG